MKKLKIIEDKIELKDEIFTGFQENFLTIHVAIHKVKNRKNKEILAMQFN